MTRTYTESVTLQEVVCESCGVTFAVPQKLLEGFQRMGKSFYCPNGHSLSYGETEGDRLRKQVKTEQERCRQVEVQLISVKDQLQATEREVQRQKKRVANGVCPCCNRSFMQLQRHMKTQHPDYTSLEGKERRAAR